MESFDATHFQVMTMPMACVVAAAALGAVYESPLVPPSSLFTVHPHVPIVQWRQACRLGSLLYLRGGSDDAEGDEDDEDDLEDGLGGEDLVTSDGAELEDNPFLGAPGAGAGGAGLQDLASTLGDPQMLQDALKELQDPAVQQQVKAMMEDPAFQESMKAYMEQITKDPQFEALKKQTEDMLQQEGFMESIQKAFAEVGGPAGIAAALSGAASGEEGEPDK